MGQLRDAVREKLNGLDVRQAQRNAARHVANLLLRVYAARSDGSLATLDQAYDTLTPMGVRIQDESYYGCTLLSLNVGVVLCYGPDGKLSWSSGSRLKHTQDGSAQLDLFSDDPTSETSSDGLCLFSPPAPPTS